MGRNGPNLLRILSIGFLLIAIVLFFVELVAYSQERARLPEGLTIAGIPVGGLDQSEALERLTQTYSTPLELHYGDQIIQVSPHSVGFQLDAESMLAAAELARTGNDFWSGYWDFLWNRPGDEQRIPLRAEYSQSQLESVLSDLAARYDEPAVPGQPVPGSPTFSTGEHGRILDIGLASELVADVLYSPNNRRVTLPVFASSPPRPTFQTLKTLLKQIVDVEGFNGLFVPFIVDLQTGEELHFTYYRGEEIEPTPDIAFTAASIIKIGIMTTYYRYFDEPLIDEQDRWLTQMITESGNDPADWLMEELDPTIGPLIVTETLQELGLESTFLAGKFRLGSELLRTYRTPGNQRTDVNTRPDVYNQTTASEMGMLLVDIYHCSKGGGNFLAVFPEEFPSSECSHMLDLLSMNEIALLLEAGAPDGTRVAHKHGWTSSPLDTVADAGVIYSPGGDYVIVMFLWNETEMIWEPTSQMFADLGRAVYNFFNPPIE